MNVWGYPGYVVLIKEHDGNTKIEEGIWTARDLRVAITSGGNECRRLGQGHYFLVFGMPGDHGVGGRLVYRGDAGDV